MLRMRCLEAGLPRQHARHSHSNVCTILEILNLYSDTKRVLSCLPERVSDASSCAGLNVEVGFATVVQLEG